MTSSRPKCLRRVFKIRWQRHIPDKTVLQMARAEKISDQVRRRRWKRIGHKWREKPTDERAVALGWAPEGKRKRSCPKTTCRRIEEAERNGAGWNSWNATQAHTSHNGGEKSRPCVPPGTERIKVKARLSLHDNRNSHSLFNLDE